MCVRMGVESLVVTDREGKHPIVAVDRPREEEVGVVERVVGVVREAEVLETVAGWRARLLAMMETDDAAEQIAKFTDSTLGVIGDPSTGVIGGTGAGWLGGLGVSGLRACVVAKTLAYRFKVDFDK